MNAETFITLSTILAILQVAEGLTLYNHRGQLSPLVLIVSTLEFIWMPVCIYALFSIHFPDWTILLPAAYLSYMIVATWRSRSLAQDIEEPEDLKGLKDNLKTIVIPRNLVLISLSFGCFNLLTSTVAWLGYVKL